MSDQEKLPKIKRWTLHGKTEVHNEKLDAFFSDLENVCIKHGLSISHEDNHGAFIFEPFCDGNMDWLKAAFDGTQ